MSGETEQRYPWRNETDFYDMHAESILARCGFYHLGMIGLSDKEFLVYVLRKLGVSRDSRYLDLGCGSGYLAGNVANLCEATGISTSRASIDVCRRRYPRARFEVANMENFVLPDATHITAFESMGYADADRTLASISRSLVPGGKFYFKELFRQYRESPSQRANREYWEKYWDYTGRCVPEFVELAYSHSLRLVEFSDISNRANTKVFRDTLQYNVAPYEMPFPDAQDFVVPVEFVFIRES